MYLLSTKKAQQLLTTEQYTYVVQKLQKSYTQLFEQLITTSKVQKIRAIDIPLTEEELYVAHWQLIDCIDYGKHQRQGKCACGMSLRYEFIIEHRHTKKRIHYGKDHLATFLNISSATLKSFQQNLQLLATQLEELFFTIQQDAQPLSYYLRILLAAEKYNDNHPAHPLHIPYDAKEQLAVGLPLIRVQRDMLEKIARRLENEKRIAEMKQLAHHYKPHLEPTRPAPPPTTIQHTLTLPDNTLPLRAQLIILISDGINSALTMAHLIYDQSCDVLDAFSIYDLRRPPIYGKIVSELMDLELEGVVRLSYNPLKAHLDCFAQFV